MAPPVTAGLNAAYFHVSPYQSVESWDVEAPAPLLAKLSVALSLVLWLGVISCGRLLAYL